MYFRNQSGYFTDGNSQNLHFTNDCYLFKWFSLFIVYIISNFKNSTIKIQSSSIKIKDLTINSIIPAVTINIWNKRLYFQGFFLYKRLIVDSLYMLSQFVSCWRYPCWIWKLFWAAFPVTNFINVCHILNSICCTDHLLYNVIDCFFYIKAFIK